MKAPPIGILRQRDRAKAARAIGQRHIQLSGQKIETYYACAAASGESRTREVYMIKSQADNDFAKKEFSEMPDQNIAAFS